MKVALVYDRVVKWGGAERVLLALHKLFPDAPLFTSVYDKTNASWADGFDVRTTCLQHIPTVATHHELYPWLMAFAFESFTFDDYNLVISVTSAEAKGIITKPHTKHICYCLTPTRYLWSHEREYMSNPLLRYAASPVVSHLKRWDAVAAQRPDVIIAISHAVRERIQKYYGRESEVIYPPAEIGNKKYEMRNLKSRFPQQDFFLVVSRLVTYKKVDMVIDAFNHLEMPLVIIGTGREERKLKNRARDNIRFIASLTDDELCWYYQHAQALICPQEEDFGLVSVEAQLQGTPVVAFGKGGSLDTVIPGKTGMFFDTQTPEAIVSMIQSYDKTAFDSRTIIQHAERFSMNRFGKDIMNIIARTMGA